MHISVLVLIMQWYTHGMDYFMEYVPPYPEFNHVAHY